MAVQIFTWQQIPSLAITDILLKCDGLDGIILDQEHGVWDKKDLFNSIRLINNSHLHSGVRFAKPYNVHLIRNCLEMGCEYFVFANYQHPDYNLIREIFKCKGIGLYAGNNWDVKEEKTLDDGESIKIIAQIEDHKTLCQLIPQKVCYIHYFMIGMYDLSKDLGCTGNFSDIKFKKDMEIFNKQVPDNMKSIHIVYPNSKTSKYNKYGMLVLGMDSTILKSGVENICRMY
jgi:2-keto-3-deoxy-L-rhamnonate aldolase RhmA